MTFHDTIGLAPDPLRAAIVQSARQEDAVLAVFQRLRRPLTPSDVHRLTTAAGKGWPLTSIRRAISNLAHGSGAPLVKTDIQRKGLYHLPECAWALASSVEQTNPPVRAMTGA